MAGITLNPDDPAAWLWLFNDASRSHKDATSDFLQAGPFYLMPYATIFVNNAFSLSTLLLGPATASTIRTVTRQPPPPVSSLAPLRTRSPLRRSHPHLSPRRPDRHPVIRLKQQVGCEIGREIVHPRDTAQIATTYTRLGDDPATSKYAIDRASVSRENDSQADPTLQSNQFLGDGLGGDFDVRGNDDRY